MSSAELLIIGPIPPFLKESHLAANPGAIVQVRSGLVATDERKSEPGNCAKLKLRLLSTVPNVAEKNAYVTKQR